MNSSKTKRSPETLAKNKIFLRKSGGSESHLPCWKVPKGNIENFEEFYLDKIINKKDM